jgi:hypothetical protein
MSNEALEVEALTTTEVTPEFVAKAFWAMDTHQQIRFFDQLAKETKDVDGYGYGDGQWCAMKRDMKVGSEALRMYMAMSAFAYDFWQDQYKYLEA